jgi:hypothetical protein
MNREEELTDILRKVEWGQMDSAVAFDQILRLFSVVGRSEQYACECKVCGKPFDNKDDLYEHYDFEHN